MAVKDVCRLCLATNDLVWIFDEENKKLKMRDVISITTGIEIHTKDIISQKVCGNCYQFSIKAFQFRSQCLKADKYLKTVCRDYLVDKKFYIPNTEVTIKGIGKCDKKIPKPKPAFKDRPSAYTVHPSVVKLSHKYPEIKLPRICLPYNITPFVEMELDRVENYFKRLNLDFNKCVKRALMPVNASLHMREENNSTEQLPTQQKDVMKSDESNRKRKDTSMGVAEVTGPKRRRHLSRNENLSKENVDKEVRPTNSNRSEFPAPLTKKDDNVVNANSHSDSANCDFNRNINCSVERTKKPVPENRVDETDDSLKTTNQGVEGCGYDLLTSGRSVPIIMCEICNSVQYSIGDLKRHQNKHMRCQFCKVRFRSIDTKKDHIENVCPIKKMMNYLPDVILGRIEHNRDVKRKYPDAFVGLFPLPNTDDNDKMERSDSPSIDFKKSLFKDCPPERLDIIEILSDDDTLIDEIQPSPADNHAPIIPDITLQHKNILPDIDSKMIDTEFLKKALSALHPSPKTVETQTTLTSNKNIMITTDNQGVLKNLMPVLSLYKVRIRMRPGDFNVTYDYNNKPKPTKRVCYWNKLK
ncbi:hypothetical protein NQ315_007296, partial [Exocentrus adspersus]